MGKQVAEKKTQKDQVFTAFYYSRNPRLVTDLGKGRSVSWSDGNVKQLEINPGLDRCGDIIRVVPLSERILFKGVDTISGEDLSGKEIKGLAVVNSVPGQDEDLVFDIVADDAGVWQLEGQFKRHMRSKTNRERIAELAKREKVFKAMVENQEKSKVETHRQDNVSGVEVKADSEAATTKGDK